MSSDPFVDHRGLLFTVAYEMLGSAADAEDVLQETWLRWADVPLEEVRDHRAYLVRITTRLALNRIRTLSRRKEMADLLVGVAGDFVPPSQVLRLGYFARLLLFGV